MAIVRRATVLAILTALAAGCSTPGADEGPDAAASEPVAEATTAADDNGDEEGDDTTAASGEFSMPITDAFEIAGGGVVVTGQVVSGTVRVGDGLCVVTGSGSTAVTVTGLEMSRDLIEEASAGDAIGAQLEGVEVADVEAGGELTAC